MQIYSHLIRVTACRYLLAEVVQNIMVPGPKQFSIHILGKEDHPYGISLRWSSQDKGMFYLVLKTAKDDLNEIVNNVSRSLLVMFHSTGLITCKNSAIPTDIVHCNYCN